MSIEAVSWALNTDKVDIPLHRLLLIALANHADSDGRSAFPSQQTIASYCCCSVRTVQRELIKLEDAGLIRRGDQNLLSHLRADRHPIVWDIVMCHGATNETPRGDNMTCRSVHGATNETPRGDKIDTTGRHSCVVQTVIEPSIEDITPYSPPTRRRDDEQPQQGDPHAGTPKEKPTKKQIDEEFEQFWAIVKKKRSKQQARKTFERQRRNHSLDFICSQLQAAQAEWERAGRDPQYWPHPSTWLNQQLEDDYEIVQAPSAQQSHIGGYYGAAERLRQKLAGGEPTWELA